MALHLLRGSVGGRERENRTAAGAVSHMGAKVEVGGGRGLRVKADSSEGKVYTSAEFSR